MTEILLKVPLQDQGKPV